MEYEFFVALLLGNLLLAIVFAASCIILTRKRAQALLEKPDHIAAKLNCMADILTHPRTGSSSLSSPDVSG